MPKLSTLISLNAQAALANANAPTAGNAFATEADLSGGGGSSLSLSPEGVFTGGAERPAGYIYVLDPGESSLDFIITSTGDFGIKALDIPEGVEITIEPNGNDIEHQDGSIDSSPFVITTPYTYEEFIWDDDNSCWRRKTTAAATEGTSGALQFSATVHGTGDFSATPGTLERWLATAAPNAILPDPPSNNDKIGFVQVGAGTGNLLIDPGTKTIAYDGSLFTAYQVGGQTGERTSVTLQFDSVADTWRFVDTDSATVELLNDHAQQSMIFKGADNEINFVTVGTNSVVGRGASGNITSIALSSLGDVTSTGSVATNDVAAYADTSGDSIKSAGFAHSDIRRISTMGTGVNTALSAGKTGTGNIVLDTSPTLVTPALGTPSSGTLTSCQLMAVSSISANTTAAVGTIYLVDSTSGTITVTLPAAASSSGKQIVVKRKTGSNSVVVDGNASETIDGATTLTLSVVFEWTTLVCDGAAWFQIS